MIGTLGAPLSTPAAVWTYDERLPTARALKSAAVAPISAARGPPGGRARTERNCMKAKLYRMGVTAAMFAVMVEALGAPLKWG
jgi:hypothetical protein